MNVEARKISLISWMTHLSDENILSKIESLQSTETDWWDLMGDEEKSEIEQGLAEIDRGEIKSHDDVMSKYKKWL